MSHPQPPPSEAPSYHTVQPSYPLDVYPGTQEPMKVYSMQMHTQDVPLQQYEGYKPYGQGQGGYQGNGGPAYQGQQQTGGGKYYGQQGGYVGGGGGNGAGTTQVVVVKKGHSKGDAAVGCCAGCVGACCCCGCVVM